MYILTDVVACVNNKCELFIKMCILLRGAGRETSQRVSAKLQKTPKKLHFLLTTPQKYDIISISRIKTSQKHCIALALRLHTSFRNCTAGTVPCFTTLLNPFTLRGLPCCKRLMIAEIFALILENA